MSALKTAHRGQSRAEVSKLQPQGPQLAHLPAFIHSFMVMLIHLHIVMVVFTLQWQLNKFSRHQMVGKSTILFGPFQKKTVKLWSRFPFYPKENVNLMPPTTILSEAGC